MRKKDGRAAAATGQKKYFLTRMLVASLAFGVGMGQFAGYGAVYVYEDEEDWDEEDWDWDEEETSSSSRRDREGRGPGTAVVEEDSAVLEGTLVDQVTLKERYHEDYKVYEESIGDLYFFYSSVGNGGITHESVTLDIPQNLSYTIELNGVPWAYVPGAPISNYGIYVVRLTAIDDPNAPLSEQKEYHAIFRFRIQEKPPEEESEEESQEENTSSSPFGTLAEGESEGLTRGFGMEGSASIPESAEIVEESLGMPEEIESQENPENPVDATGSGEEIVPETGAEESQEGLEDESTGSRIQIYDPSSRRYQVTFPEGQVLTANVPEGYVGPDAVELNVSALDGEDLILYRDDEPIEYFRGTSLTEPGHYRLELKGQPWSCTITSYINQAYCYAAPEGMHFTAVLLDGEPFEFPSERYVMMETDGTYQFELEGEAGNTLSTRMIMDTIPPQIEVTVRGGSASIQYLSEDIEEIRLEKDGELQEGFSGYSISQPGVYRLTVLDNAGNEASTQFTLKYQMNRYSVIAIVLVILLIAGGVAFVIYTKRNVKIR